MAGSQVVDLETLTPEEAAARLGVSLDVAAEALANEREVLAFADVFIIDPEAGVRMTDLTYELLHQ